MNVVLNSAVDGLLLGLIYGLAATGLTLIFGVMRVVNLAHGAAIVCGMFGVFFLAARAGLNPYLSLVLVASAGLVLGTGTYFVALRRVIDAPELMTLMATYSISLIIVGAGTLLFSTSPYTMSVDLGTISLGAVRLQGNRMVAGLFSLATVAVLYGFLFHTRFGVYVRAAASNRVALSLVGVNPTLVLGFSFGLGVMLASVGGGLIATLFPFTILSGGPYELRSFLIVVLGGLGSPSGALLGGIVLGLVEGVATAFIQVSWVPVLEFTLLVVLLLLRPQGLLSRGG